MKSTLTCLLIEGGHELTLEVVLHEVDEEVHHGLGYRVLDALPDDVEVGFDQSLDHLVEGLTTV